MMSRNVILGTTLMLAPRADAGSIRRRPLALLLALWLFGPHDSANAAATPDAAPSVLTLPSGQSLLIRYPGVKRVAVGDGTVIEVKVLNDTQEILVVGTKEGLTDLRIWSRDGTVVAYLIKVTGSVAVARPPATTLEARPTILIKAKLIEVRKSALRDIGIDWADVAAGPTFGTLNEYVTNRSFRVIPGSIRNLDGLPLDLGASNNYFALTTVVDSMINLLVNDGNARLLAQPTLSCIDGGQADFLVGGEVPIPVQNQDGALNVIFKQFGIILNVEPRTNDTGLIRTKVNVEVSSVDKAIQVLGIPGFATRKTSTEMNVQSGETMVVAGLFSSEDAKNVVKVPALGQIPVLGELFKSRQFRRGETELVVLVTPQIVTADSEAVQAATRQFEALQQKSEAAVQFKLMD
jgi:pilus assembly protein CpaC